MSLPPLRRQVLVGCDTATAYRLWLDDIGTWWPLERFSCFGDGARVSFQGEQIIETAPSGETALWGSITEAREPSLLSFTWHPGRDAAQATHVTVSFTPTSDEAATLVTLVHTGWEALADPAAGRAEYGEGWLEVLDRLPDTPGSADGGKELWFVLEHRPGPSAPPGGVFGSADFAKHVEFLSSLRGEGVLMAGGSLPDDPDCGMTVVRVPDASTGRRVLQAAQSADGSVASGLLEVRIRPWRVAMSAA
jgi:uncharacterized protein YndB with AHSA1/START domain/uncharacterized protein YciI